MGDSEDANGHGADVQVEHEQPLDLDSSGLSFPPMGHPKMNPCPSCGKMFFPWSLKTHLKRCGKPLGSNANPITRETEEEAFESLSEDSLKFKHALDERSNRGANSEDRSSSSRLSSNRVVEVPQRRHNDDTILESKGIRAGVYDRTSHNSSSRNKDDVDAYGRQRPYQESARNEESLFCESVYSTDGRKWKANGNPSAYQSNDRFLHHGSYQEIDRSRSLAPSRRDEMGTRHETQYDRSRMFGFSDDGFPPEDAYLRGYDEVAGLEDHRRARNSMSESNAKPQSYALRASSRATPTASPATMTTSTRGRVSQASSFSSQPGSQTTSTRTPNRASVMPSAQRTSARGVESPKSLSEIAREERELAERARQAKEEQLLAEKARLQREIDKINDELKFLRAGKGKTNQTITPSRNSPETRRGPTTPASATRFRPRFEEPGSRFNPRGIDPSNATSPDNPLATSVYQTMHHPPIVRRGGGTKFVV